MTKSVYLESDKLFKFLKKLIASKFIKHYPKAVALERRMKFGNLKFKININNFWQINQWLSYCN